MKLVTVGTANPYCVYVGSGLLTSLGQRLKQFTTANKLAIISDSNVWPLYGDAASNSLKNAGFTDVLPFVFPAGEQSKNGETFLSVLEFLAKNQVTRSDCIIALGGGVVGDMAGFAAATYLRGINFVQVPTTLLAAVDSSVGGKTAINLQAGKNLAGAFYQPCFVLCDTDTLRTLPPDVFRDGCAEVIKYGILYDTGLFCYLSEHGLGFDREYVITRCVELKRDVVLHDEFDRGDRQKLNLGHTIGHGIERCSQLSLSHGKAVAIGMAVIARYAERSGHCIKRECDRIIDILQKFSLPVSTVYDAQAIYAAALSDKKRKGDIVNLIVPRAIGHCDILPTAVSKLKYVIEMGL